MKKIKKWPLPKLPTKKADLIKVLLKAIQDAAAATSSASEATATDENDDVDGSGTPSNQAAANTHVDDTAQDIDGVVHTRGAEPVSSQHIRVSAAPKTTTGAKRGCTMNEKSTGGSKRARLLAQSQGGSAQ